jgi:prepilin-type N-terminal cleavage/methylation domain-containing protein
MFKSALKTNLNQKGFTLVELLIVVVIIGIMSGVLIVVINPQKQRERAQDGVRVGNISKLVQSIEAFRAGEGVYPADKDAMQAADTKYIQNWPSDAVYTYVRAGSSPYDFCISVPMAANSSTHIRYQSAGTTGANGVNPGKIYISCGSICSNSFATYTDGSCKPL